MVSGCTKVNEKINSAELDKIEIYTTKITESDSGRLYLIKLKNGSAHKIKQNVVYLSYPIIKGGRSTTNKAKVEALENKTNILPGEEVELNIFMPVEDYKNNSFLDSNHPEIEFKYYIDDISDTNYFIKIGPLIEKY